MMFLSSICLLLALVSANAEYSRWTGYDGYQVLRVTPQNSDQVRLLRFIGEQDEVDVYSEARKSKVPVEVMIPPSYIDHITSLLSIADVPFEVQVENYQDYLDAEWNRLAKRTRDWSQFAFDLDDFNTYEDIQNELDLWAERCEDYDGVNCEIYEIGRSIENRTINVFKISKERDDDGERNAFWVDSAIHAREWVAPSTNLKILNEFTSQYGADADITDFIDSYDWYFIIIMNPDGYVFSWETERMWRKSRNENEGSLCIGTDLNRNYDQNWMEIGASSDPCSNTYAGSSAGSEPETQAVQNEILRIGDTLLGFVTIHTAANMWLHPWGLENEDGSCYYDQNEEYLNYVSEAAAMAIMETHNTVWTYGNGCETIYATSGTTQDYAYGAGGIPYSTTPELRGPGFDPGQDAIQPAFEETFNGLKAMVRAIEDYEGARR